MTKVSEDAFLDGSLLVIKNTATRQTLCKAEPARTAGAAPTLAQINTERLAEVAMTSADYVIDNGDVNGRKVTIAAKGGVPTTVGGLATHVVLDDGTKQLYATTCTNQSLTAGNPVNIPTWRIEIADPI